MKKRIRVGILFGGRSAEHEVSLQSAKNVIDAIDKKKYEVVLIGIDKAGIWRIGGPSRFILNAANPKLVKLNRLSEGLALVPGDRTRQLVKITQHEPVPPIDVIFPILHGPFGEDGTVQGLLKMADLPFVGASVLGSAVGMDKDVMKRLLRDAKIPTPNFVVLQRAELASVDFRDVARKIGLPCFVKPANLGSSVGISKVKRAADFKKAIGDAFEYDRKIIIEEYIAGRELECSVLGNENPLVSVPGEVIPQHEFYSYDAKYIDENGAVFKVPAELPPPTTKAVQELAVKTFKALCCEGMARVDFFLRDNRELFVNELNTIPGFTKISMYPKLWEATGISYGRLIDRLIQLALDRHKKEKRLKTSYHP